MQKQEATISQTRACKNTVVYGYFSTKENKREVCPSYMGLTLRFSWCSNVCIVNSRTQIIFIRGGDNDHWTMETR